MTNITDIASSEIQAAAKEHAASSLVGFGAKVVFPPDLQPAAKSIMETSFIQGVTFALERIDGWRQEARNANS